MFYLSVNLKNDRRRTIMQKKKRCEWVSDESLYIEYHDKEWGRETRDSLRLFEMLCLEGQQAGLSWWLILQRRENYRQVFADFNPHVLAGYDDRELSRLLEYEGIIRNKLKIKSIINNAKAYLRIEEGGRSFSDYIWEFTDGQIITNCFRDASEVPSESLISQKMSRQLKKDGFSFVGPTICYAYMQAVGMVNDHTSRCFLYPGKKTKEQ